MLKANFALIAMLFISGCRSNPGLPAPPAVDLSAELRPGMHPDEVEKLLGTPSSKEFVEGTKPLIQQYHYKGWGVVLSFYIIEQHSGYQLGRLRISEGWPNTCAGIRIGDVEDQIKDKTTGVSNGRYEFRSKHWPTAYCIIQKGTGIENPGVYEMELEDKRIVGLWLPQ